MGQVMQDEVTALATARDGGHDSVVELLLSRGADVVQTRQDGFMALLSACTNGHCDEAELLLDQGIDVGQVTHSGMTALVYACLGGHRDASNRHPDRCGCWYSTRHCGQSTVQRSVIVAVAELYECDHSRE